MNELYEEAMDHGYGVCKQCGTEIMYTTNDKDDSRYGTAVYRCFSKVAIRPDGMGHFTQSNQCHVLANDEQDFIPFAPTVTWKMAPYEPEPTATRPAADEFNDTKPRINGCKWCGAQRVRKAVNMTYTTHTIRQFFSCESWYDSAGLLEHRSQTCMKNDLSDTTQLKNLRKAVTDALAIMPKDPAESMRILRLGVNNEYE